MKKYFLSLTAVVVALAFSAFTEATKSPQANHFFEYTGTSYTTGDVTTPSRYTYIPSGGALCGGTAAACIVRVTDAYVDNPGSPSATLKSTVNLTATMNGTKAELTGIANPSVNAYSNEAE